MSGESFPSFAIDSDFQVEAYAKWFLRLPVETVEGEFSPEERKKFLNRRELRLNAELDDLLNLKFDSPHVCNLQKKKLFKFVKSIYKKPLSAEGSFKALGIPNRVVKNEWFSLNDEFEIPTSGQILGTIARVKGFKGILYTSVRTQTSSNLVIFEENTGPLSFTLINESDLDARQFLNDTTG